jgi:hypothetical protein
MSDTYDPHAAMRERHQQFEREIGESLPSSDAELLDWLADRLPFRKGKAAIISSRLREAAKKLKA